MDSMETAIVDEARVRQDESTEVHRFRWSPPSGTPERPRGVYLMHGTGEHAGRYERLVARLTAAGWQVGAHDHPGHGLSGGLRGRVPVPGAFATCAAIECMRFAHETGAAPFLFGHSLGGMVAAELVLMHRMPVAGLLLSAPAIVPKLTWRDVVKLKTLSLLAPTRVLDLGYNPARLTHDLDEQRAALADPLIHGLKSAEFIGWLVSAAERVADVAWRLDVPTLMMIAEDDVITDIKRTRQFVADAPEGLVDTKLYSGCHHELLNADPESRGQVEQDILHWLERRANA